MAELQAEFPDLEIEFKLMEEMWDVRNYCIVEPSRVDVLSFFYSSRR